MGIHSTLQLESDTPELSTAAEVLCGTADEFTGLLEGIFVVLFAVADGLLS
jgi:hypothetical protein